LKKSRGASPCRWVCGLLAVLTAPIGWIAFVSNRPSQNAETGRVRTEV
jgi:hypothetical protein